MEEPVSVPLVLQTIEQNEVKEVEQEEVMQAYRGRLLLKSREWMLQ